MKRQYIRSLNNNDAGRRAAEYDRQAHLQTERMDKELLFQRAEHWRRVAAGTTS